MTSMRDVSVGLDLLLYNLNELKLEVERHHQDFEKISQLCHDVHGSDNPDILNNAIKDILNIVG